MRCLRSIIAGGLAAATGILLAAPAGALPVPRSVAPLAGRSPAAPPESVTAARAAASPGTPPVGAQPVARTAAASGDGATYRMVAADGGIFSFGGAAFEGSAGGLPLAQPVVGMAATADGQGYWMVAADGGIFNYGDAQYLGSLGGTALPAPIVGMAATPDGGGYWLVGADGSVYPFGDAGNAGSLRGTRLNRPIVGMAASPDGRGYWLVASDGGVFTFGDATFYGSTGNLRLVRPVVGIAASPDGRGYWLVASDGGVFSYGDAVFHGSTGNLRLVRPVVGMAPTPDGQGYWLVASDGGIFAFGGAGYEGSMGNQPLIRPVVGMAVSYGRTGTANDATCPAGTTLPGEGPWRAESVAVPALPSGALPGAPTSYTPAPGQIPDAYLGTLFEPPPGAYPGARPAVVLLHGIAGDQCQMWWLAQYLAGAGYVALAVTSPTPVIGPPSYGVAIDAARSAVHFLASAYENPYLPVTDAGDVGLAGWSEGSIVASYAQGLPDMGQVKAIAALDNLRGSLAGDSGAPQTYCVAPVQGPVTPTVPALGFAMDGPCPQEPSDTSPTLKQSGYARWVAAGLPTVELPMAGYGHFDFDDPSPKLDPVGQLTLAWFDAWLLHPQNPDLGAFQSCSLVPLLSTTFDAGAYLPSLGINSSDYRSQLQSTCAG